MGSSDGEGSQDPAATLRRWNWICGIGLVASLIFLGTAQARMSMLEKTSGVVTSSDRYRVQVEYTVDGQTHRVSGDQVTRGGGGSGGLSRGASIGVYFDPDDPADAVLATGDRRKMPALFLLMFAVLLAFAHIQHYRDR